MKKKRAISGLLNKNEFLFLFMIIFLFFFNCNIFPIKKELELKNKKNESLIFKEWLKDTIIILKANKIKYKVYQDSLLLDVFNQYDTIFSNKAKPNNKDLLLAYDLLEENNNLNMNGLQLKFEIIHSYEESKTGRKYDHYLEIKKFIASNNGKGYTYHYIKGNLTDKSEIKIE